MSLVRKYKGPKRAVLVRGELYDQAVKFADKEGFTLASVFETAIEEFLEDRGDDARVQSIAASKAAPTAAKAAGR